MADIRIGWSPTEDDILISWYQSHGAGAVASLTGRTMQSVYRRAAQLRQVKVQQARRCPPAPEFELVLRLIQEECAASLSPGLTSSTVFIEGRGKVTSWVRARVFRRLRALGHSNCGIAKAFDCQPSAVYHALKRDDLDNPPMRRVVPKSARARIVEFAAEHAS